MKRHELSFFFRNAFSNTATKNMHFKFRNFLDFNKQLFYTCIIHKYIKFTKEVYTNWRGEYFNYTHL